MVLTSSASGRVLIDQLHDLGLRRTAADGAREMLRPMYADRIGQHAAISGRSTPSSNLAGRCVVRPRSMAALRRANCGKRCLNAAMNGRSSPPPSFAERGLVWLRSMAGLRRANHRGHCLDAAMKRHPLAPSLGHSDVGSTQKAAIQATIVKADDFMHVYAPPAFERICLSISGTAPCASSVAVR